ncbi:MAG: DUF177 domain-containing protein [Prevotella sp.]|nr:DUF177 domain-containing protein [Bacteroides sp.]MCM1366799.1 DUF177 domain-containing protein [Prevotella sp.]MCM1437473.1 DUF177 domain-containing protein [Prevotella sp.]
MKKTDFMLPVAILTEGEHQYEYSLDADFFKNLGNDEILNSNIDATVDVIRRGDRYILSFAVKGDITIPCHRCLDPLSLPVDARYELNLRYGDRYDDTNDGILVIPQNQRDLDVAPLIADTVLLTIPLRAVHPDGGCNPDMEARIS